MTTVITGVLATNVDEPTGDITLVLGGSAGQKPYAIQVVRGCVPMLVATLMGQMRKSQHKYAGGAGFSGQPAILTRAQKFALPDGRGGIVLTLDNSIPLPIIMDENRIEGLRTVLGELKDLLGSPPRVPTAN